MPIFGTIGSSTFRNAAGSTIARPNFSAWGSWGYYTHNFTSGDSGSFGSTTGHQAFPAMNNVNGLNTTGFNASSTPGSCYYDIPLDGIYAFSFNVLINTYISNHIDCCFHLTDSASNTWRDTVPWSTQYTGANGNYGPVGFYRMDENDGIQISPGVSVIARFYQGQRIRPQLSVNVSVSATVYCDSHNFWHGAYIGA
jgi:hypothetical protein